MRTRLIATAIKTCCKWVLWRPSYLARRNPMPRTPCESVPSMPARRAYRLRNSDVCCSCRRACKAECAACGRRCSTRPVVWDRVQSLRTGQPAHTCFQQRPLRYARLLDSSANSGVLAGKSLGFLGQSSWKCATSKPLPALACQLLSDQGGTQQSDPILLLTADQQLRIDIASIHELLIRQQIVLGQVLLDGVGYLHILHIGHGGLHLHDQLRHGPGSFRGHAGLGQMRFLSQPCHLPLFARSCFWVIGGTDDAFALTGLRACPPLGLASRQLVILLPDLAQELDTGLVLECVRSAGLLQRLQQMQSVSTDLLCQCCALAFGFGQAIILDPVAVALKPVRADPSYQPLRRQGGQIIQDGAERFSDTFQVGERAHPCQYMGRIGALLAPGFEPAPLRAHLQEPIQKQRLRTLIHQTHAKIGQQGEVKAGIGQFQPTALYFQSIRSRTALAAWRSVRFSAYCSTVTSASRQGA